MNIAGICSRVVKITSSVIFLWVISSTAYAADITVSPNTGSIAAGTTLSVNIMVSNNNEPINAISANLSFPVDLLSVKSISKDGSIIKLWAEEPSFSNTDGYVRFEGVILNPGFSGTSGKVVTVNFTTKRTGKAALLFTSGSVLANDGEATNVLRALGGASFNVAGNTVTETVDVTKVKTEVSTTPNPLAPNAPDVTSSTHPNQDKWYSNNTPSFSWSIPDDVTAVNLLSDNNPDSVPSKTYSPAIASKNLEAVSDGVHYFHVQFKNAFGWGAVAHFKFQIDTKPPNRFKISFPHGINTDDPRPIVLFNTTDDVSGIDRYDVRVGGGDLLAHAPDAKSNPYSIPAQEPGTYTILVRALDLAGNFTTESTDFTILPIQKPVITEYPSELQNGDLLKVRGTTYPIATVEVYLKDSNGKVSIDSTKSNSLGDFTLVWSKRISKDVYSMTARVINDKGAKSPETDPVTVVMLAQPIIRLGLDILNYTVVVILLLVALAAVVVVGWRIFGHLMFMRKRVRKDMLMVENMVHKDFETVKEDIKANIKLLEKARGKRELTGEELAILSKLAHYVDVIERNVLKGLDLIDKDTK